MATEAKKDKLRAFYRDMCMSLQLCMRALSLYSPEHPGTKKKVAHLFRLLNTYLTQRTSLTLLFIGGHVTVENTGLPEISGNLRQLIQWMGAIHLERVVFRRGLGSGELVRFFQLLLSLFKDPSNADLVLAKNQESLPHIITGGLPLEIGSGSAQEDSPGTLEKARKAVLSISNQLKDLFTGINGALSKPQLSKAEKVTEKIRGMNVNGKIPLKILIYRRSADPDPYLHALNVSALSMSLSERLELEESTVLEVGLSALLHDIGLHLTSGGPLSKTPAVKLEEKKLQWEHPIRGSQILLATAGIPEIAPLVAYEHHIHYDGDGYPKQKRPRNLNMASMITFITNSYDNLRRNRPEHDALSLTDTLNWMDRRLGTHFHPILLKQFRALIKAPAEEQV